MMQKQGEGGEGLGRMRMMMTGFAEARLRRAATSDCKISYIIGGRAMTTH